MTSESATLAAGFQDVLTPRAFAALGLFVLSLVLLHLTLTGNLPAQIGLLLGFSITSLLGLTITNTVSFPR